MCPADWPVIQSCFTDGAERNSFNCVHIAVLLRCMVPKEPTGKLLKSSQNPHLEEVRHCERYRFSQGLVLFSVHATMTRRQVGIFSIEPVAVPLFPNPPAPSANNTSCARYVTGVY